jgi:hypothetical protein
LSSSKDISKLVSRLRKQGWRVERTKKSHWKVYAPDGVVFLSGTPGSPRVLMVSKRCLNRHGIPREHTGLVDASELELERMKAQLAKLTQEELELVVLELASP